MTLFFPQRMVLPKLRSSTWLKLNCALTIIVTILLLSNIFQRKLKIVHDIKYQEYNPCCASPCENGGICVSLDKNYYCDCTDSGYSGANCQQTTLKQTIKNFMEFRPSSTKYTMFEFSTFWRIVNSVSLFRHIFNKNLYTIATDYGKASFKWAWSFDFNLIDFYKNFIFSARSLPPIPSICPTPMGINGPKQLPTTEILYNKLFKRQHFKWCPRGTNLLFAIYLQHFVSQFDNFEEKGQEWATNVIDMSHVYGKNEKTTNALRSFEEGKLKSRRYEEEEYPPYLDDCEGVQMIYPEKSSESLLVKLIRGDESYPKWALGNPSLSLTPMLFAMSTIWLREHNRICTLLATEHDQWTDEKLYRTARLIVTGEVIKITMTEVIKHILQSQMDVLYKPELTSNLDIYYTGSTPKEFFLLPHWQCQLPDNLKIGEQLYNMSDILFSNNNLVFRQGLDNVVKLMTTTPAGKMTHGNVGETFKPFIMRLINDSRELRVQSFNNYRKRFGIKPVKTFEELTGDLHAAATLKELYVDVDAIELIPGLLAEKCGNGVAPPSMTAMWTAWLIRGLLSHPINSPDWWKPSTFGGKTGMAIIESASLKKLICLNIKNKCHNMRVGFTVPKKRKRIVN